jgi:hypothetical protein
VRVGLYGSENSRGPFSVNVPRGHNEINGAVGTAERYLNGAYHGLDAWYATDAGISVRIGLTDARHVRAGGFRRSVPEVLTNSGFVAGSSARFNGATEVGQTAWIYERATNAHVPLVLSERSSDHFAYSRITHLLEDGTAYGVFRKFASSGASLGDRAFIFVPGQGARELGSVLDIEIPGPDWRLLARPDFVTPDGRIVGDGLLAGYGPGAPPRQYAHGVFLVQP